MRTIKHIVITVALTFSLAACATTPDELVEARATYEQATQAQTAQNAPTELREARKALNDAERHFKEAGNEPSTRALAYVAKRKAQRAMITAEINRLQQQQLAARQTLMQETERARREAQAQLREREAAMQMTQAELERERERLENLRTDLQQAQQRGEMTQAELQEREQELQQREQELQQAQREIEARDVAMSMTITELEQERERLEELRDELEQARQRGEMTQTELDQREQELQQAEQRLQEEMQARQAAEQQLAEALARLEEFGDVRQEEEGTVLTIRGEVLFELDKAELLPAAQERLAEVAGALKETEKRLVIEGHTDSQGSESYNQKLSHRRAQAVQSFLVSQGIDSQRIEAIGKGESEPVASNATASGRAMNRRVEIIIRDQTPQEKEQAQKQTP